MREEAKTPSPSEDLAWMSPVEMGGAKKLFVALATGESVLSALQIFSLADRFFDKSVQKLKRRGLVRYDKGDRKWHLTPRGQTLADHMKLERRA